MPFIKKTCTKEEGYKMLLQNNEMKEIYEKYRNSDIKYTRISLTKWFFNEEEDARFCLLDVSTAACRQEYISAKNSSRLYFMRTC
ncbi:hypothetical protein V2E67_002796 [Citrobacter freundii]|nr:hypothetical protein [Citrobacter freundii]